MRPDEVDDRAIADWCAMWLRARPVEILASGGHLSRVSELLLANGRRVVVKVRPEQPRLAGCAYVQQHLWRTGYPCPEPLIGPVPFGIDTGLAASAEAWVPGGEILGPRESGAVDAYATLLARMIRLAPSAQRLPSLDPPPPWNAWNHGGRGVWPAADDRPDDLNDIPATAWLDDVVRAVQRRLAVVGVDRLVAGHGDFEAQNVRFRELSVTAGLHYASVVVHDWDSVIVAPEAVLVGFAAAVWPSGVGPPSTIDQTADFIEAYQRAGGRTWSPDGIEAAWAAGLWVRAFNEKKWRIDGYVALQPDEAAERLRRGGVTA
jgi:Ser/Thr protein kinase RdoA (MazF antagonist)